jgi:hypothetical protein
MYTDPYLETCCRSALHRLTLAEGAGRPADLADGACLRRLAAMGFAASDETGRYTVTPEGVTRHALEILHK